MSTTINVTVDDGGLPAKNRQQTAANRQAYVQKTASEQAAEGGVQALRAKRIAEGRDPLTGALLGSPGASSRLPRIDQEPAANRRGSPLGSFYIAQRPVFEGETIYEEYKFTSGDGQQSALVRLKISTDYANQRPADVSTTVTVPVGDPCNLADPGYFQQTETIIEYSVLNSTAQAFGRSFMLPLTDTTCLYVFAYKTPTIPVLTTRSRTIVRQYAGQSTVGGGCAIGSLLSESTTVNTFTAETIEDKLETQYVCVLAGQSVCRVIDTPAGLATAIEDAVQFDYEKLTDTYGPILGLTVSYPYYSIVLPAGYSPISGLLYSGLGLSRQGFLATDAATPISWFALDSFVNSREIEEAQTYQDLLSPQIVVGTTKVTDLLLPDKQLGLVSGEPRLLRRSDGLYLSGSVSQANYPYAGTGWSQSPKKLAPSTTPATPAGFNAYQRYYIYTWDNRGFCSAQAQRYGILAALT